MRSTTKSIFGEQNRASKLTLYSGGETAIEVKGASSINNRDLRPLNGFIETYAPRRAIVVCNEKEERIVGKIRIMPWRNFLRDLWNGKIIT